MEITSFGLIKLEKGRGNGCFRGGFQASTRQKNRQQHPRLNRKIPPRHGDNKVTPSNPMEGTPREQV